MRLDEFFHYKNQVIDDILNSETIPPLIDDTEKYSNDYTKLVYTHIFPYEYVPETIQDGATYVCIEVDIDKSFDKMVYQPVIYIYVFTHKSRLRLPGGGVRVDEICHEIDNVVDGSLFYGLGKLELDTVKRFAPMTDYQGHVMRYIAKDIKKYANHTQRVPINRKSG